MQLALDEAKKAAETDEVPVGCVIVDDKGDVISAAYNTGEHGKNAMEHAEVKAMREASEILVLNSVPQTLKRLCSMKITRLSLLTIMLGNQP